ncbi:MAG TPA: hypothetical protein VHU43_05375 [Steroidobacteraceae bacterium]|jgi:hypothetical protein|nr:hypothetical protein [Steroidobacteraceae bacterium]
MSSQSGFASVLHAAGPAPERAEKLNLYGQLIGDWDADITAHSPDGKSYPGQGEIHFGWILQGRAIQDVWMIPPLKERKPGATPMPVAGNWYGTTLRIHDPAMDAWRIYWIDPATNAYRYQIGRQDGKDIVQEGNTEAGTHSRWRFTEITRDSFRWLAETSADGKTWALVVEIRARRVSM